VEGLEGDGGAELNVVTRRSATAAAIVETTRPNLRP
jgi:hypothetical protein